MIGELIRGERWPGEVPESLRKCGYIMEVIDIEHLVLCNKEATHWVHFGDWLPSCTYHHWWPDGVMVLGVGAVMLVMSVMAFGWVGALLILVPVVQWQWMRRNDRDIRYR